MAATDPANVREPTAGYGTLYTTRRTPCSWCGSGRTRTTRTMPPPKPQDEYRVRYHLCRNCGRRFRSSEPCALETRN
jgi:hypothetical protein